MPTLEDDIRSSVEAMFYTPNYCDLYIHANQIREMLGIDKMLIDMVIEENKWAIEQFRKYVGSHKVSVLKEDSFETMLDVVDNMIEKADETNTAPRELLYMYLRDEWLSQLHAVVENALDAIGNIDDMEDYDG